jgi:hypothetical protein
MIKQSKYFLTGFFLLTVLLSGFAPKKDGRTQDRKTKQLARQWIMTGMEVNGKAISTKMIERQQRNGMVTILEFRKNGSCSVKIKTAQGRTTKRNKWRFEDKQKKLIITHKTKDGAETKQVFDILKISSKKLILSLKDRRETQIFIYKAYKPKKRRR